VHQDRADGPVDATELAQLGEEMFQSWTGAGADAAKARLTALIEARHRQAEQLTKSAAAFTACDHALVGAQRQARTIVAQAEAVGRALDAALRGVQLAMDAMTGGGAIGWVVEKTTGVDIEAKGRELMMAALRPIYEEALGLLGRMQMVIHDYEKVLLEQAAVLRGMPGVVRTDAGPVDLPGDAELRRGALFESVYGHPPETANDKLMAEALDMQGEDAANIDPNSRLVVSHIALVPGAGVVHGAAFISASKEWDPQLNPLNPQGLAENDKGDARGFDPNAGPSNSRLSYDIDYERGIVVVRQNASHSDSGRVAVGDPSVGIEQDPTGRVRLRLDGTNPLGMKVGQDMHISVRGDLVVDPHGGHGPATIDGDVTRFPAWEAYQTHNGAGGVPLMQRPEDDVVVGPVNVGPLQGLPQGTVPAGSDPDALPQWRSQFHPTQGSNPPLAIPPNVPILLGDDFFKYALRNTPYPTIDGSGRLAIPTASQVR